MVITGWKEIAGALSVSVPTAKRLRVSAGLPVGNMTPRCVFALRVEIERWLVSRREPTWSLPADER